MPRNNILKYLLIVLKLYCVSTCVSQSINFKSNYYSIKDGLPSSQIFDAIQDSRGFIWISSYRHLTRFDGYNFYDIIPLSPKADKNFEIHSLIGEGSKLERVNKEYILLKSINKNSEFGLINATELNFKNYALNQLLQEKNILNIQANPITESILISCLDHSDLILYNFHPKNEKIEKVLHFSLAKFLSKDLVNVQLAVNQINGLVYFTAATLPLFQFDLVSGTNKKFTIPISEKGYKKIKSLQTDEIVFLDNDQKKVLILDLLSQRIRIIDKGFQTYSLDEMWVDLDGNIILANITNRVYKKLYLIPYKSNNVISLDFILKTENLISQLSGDHFLDQILMSTYSGFYTLTNEKKRFKTVLSRNVKNGNFGHVIRSMVEDGKGSLYINEEKNKLFKLNLYTDTIEKIFKNSPYPEVAINGSLKKIDNELWGVCAKNPDKDQLYGFDINTEKFQYWPLPFENFAIKAMAVVDTNQLLCFGRDFKIDTPAIYLFKTKTKEWIKFDFAPKVPTIKFQFALQDDVKQIWLGTSTGLYLIHVESKQINKVEFIPTEDTSLNISVHTLALHPVTKFLLIGTEQGVWIYDPLQKKYVDHFTNKSSGISNDNIEGILPKNDEELFVTTDNGLSLLNSKTKISRNYYENDGLAHNEFNVLAAHKGSNGHYYFGGLNGLTIVTDSSLNEYNAKKPAISRFYKYNSKSNNEINYSNNIETIKNVIVEPEDQYFGFDMMYPDYTEPRLNQFQTWLEGYENDWQQPIANNKIRYGRLPKGNYTFHVRSFPNIKNEIKVSVQVKEHFYHSPWFSSGLAILLIGGGLGIYVRYQQKKRNEELEIQKNNQKFKDLEAAALRAQMNPHFIFNCLGSIQQFINEHDAESASKYLANFARLVRLSLHSSVDGKHSLQDEIDMLDNYLGLERLRFGEKFIYEIQVDPALDKEDIYLPPLLIQPFVENALLHGMKNKIEGGKIIVSFNQSNQGIEASVTDNGPGISAEKRSMDSSGHKSIGMTLTKKRLEILSNNDVFKVSSVLDNEGVVTGTKVSLVIPLL